MHPAAELVADREHVLLDFGGPVCTVFGRGVGGSVAARLRAYAGTGIPASDDPYAVLRRGWTVSVTTGRLIELELREHEIVAVGTAVATPGTLEVVRTLALRGHTVTVVSDVSADAVGVYLSTHEIGRYVHEVSARHSEEPTPLLPDPFLVTQAVYLLHTTPDRCCVVGDTAAVIGAARAAGVPVVGHAAGPAGRSELSTHGPNALIDHLAELVA